MATKKAAAKTEAVETVETVVEEVKKTTRKKMVPAIVVQWDANEVSVDAILEKAKAEYKAEHKGAITSCNIYIKPQEGMAYYVINDVDGKFAL